MGGRVYVYGKEEGRGRKEEREQDRQELRVHCDIHLEDDKRDNDGRATHENKKDEQ